MDSVYQSISWYRCRSTIPTSRNHKSDWYASHQRHEHLAESTKPTLLLCGDSIVAGLSRYADVWKNTFQPLNTLNMGIPGDKTQNVLWRAKNFALPRSTQSVIIHCGTNNVDYDQPRDVALGVVSVGLAFLERSPNLTIFITGLLPRDSKASSRRFKIVQINNYLKYYCETKLKNFRYLDHHSDYLCDDGSLRKELYYKDRLHLVEKGNALFANRIISFFTKLSKARVKFGTFNKTDSSKPRYTHAKASKQKFEKCWYVHKPPTDYSLSCNSGHTARKYEEDFPECDYVHHAPETFTIEPVCHSFTKRKNQKKRIGEQKKENVKNRTRPKKLSKPKIETAPGKTHSKKETNVVNFRKRPLLFLNFIFLIILYLFPIYCFTSFSIKPAFVNSNFVHSEYVYNRPIIFKTTSISNNDFLGAKSINITQLTCPNSKTFSSTDNNFLLQTSDYIHDG